MAEELARFPITSNSSPLFAFSPELSSSKSPPIFAMSPKKISAALKGKSAAQSGEGASSRRGGGPKPALFESRVSSVAHLARARPLAAADSNEWGATELQPGGVPDALRAPFYPIFLHTLFAGLVPPFSDFFLAVLEQYQIHLLHLHPNSILVLSMFAFFCEAYIGVRPSVDLFRCFFSLRFSSNSETTGCVSFRSVSRFIPVAWDGEAPVSEVTQRVDDFRQRWLFVKVTQRCPLLAVPAGRPTKHRGWSGITLDDPSLGPLFKFLEEARACGLTGQMVTKEFLRRRIAPLQAHKSAIWTYSGASDVMRLSEEGFSARVLDGLMEILFATSQIPEPRSRSSKPLYMFATGTRNKQLAAMPAFTAWGLVSRGRTGPHEDFALMAQLGPSLSGADSTDSVTSSFFRDAEASGGPGVSARDGASGGAGGFPRMGGLEAELLEISSSDEASSRAAPELRRVREVREGSSSARPEPQMREPPSRPEEDLGKVSSETRAEKALETLGASASQPRRTKRRKWVDGAIT